MKKPPLATSLVASALAILGILWVLTLPSIGFAPMREKVANTNVSSAKLELFALPAGYGFSWASIVAGIGISRLKNWARQLGVISSWVLAGLMLMVVGQMVTKTMMGPESGPALGAGVFYALVGSFYGFSGWYFLRPAVKAQFISKTTNR